MARMKVRPSAMRRRYSAIWTRVHMCVSFFSTFINFALPSCNVHRSCAHPSWMTAPIQGRRFYVHCDSPFSPVAARDFELSATRVSKRSRLLRLYDNGQRAPIRRSGGALCRSKPQDDILISFVDWTLAIIDPLKSSGLSPGKRPGSFSVSRNASESPVTV